MKTNIVIALLLAFSQSACDKPDGEPVAHADLEGNWSGDLQTQQLGSCSWNTPNATATATFQLVGSNHTTGTVKATVIQTIGPNSIPVEYTGTINGTNVVMSNSNKAICDGVSRTYVARLTGTLNGNTLTMISRDTLCPTQACIFLRTLRLTR
ncbi:hypothetical protein [Spirosoma pomorum]